MDSQIYHIATFDVMDGDLLLQHYTQLFMPSVVFTKGLWGETTMFLLYNNPEQQSNLNAYNMRYDFVEVVLKSKFAYKTEYDMSIFSENKFIDLPLHGFLTKILIEFFVEQIENVTEEWSTGSHASIELHEYFNYEDSEASITSYEYIAKDQLAAADWPPPETTPTYDIWEPYTVDTDGEEDVNIFSVSRALI